MAKVYCTNCKWDNVFMSRYYIDLSEGIFGWRWCEPKVPNKDTNNKNSRYVNVNYFTPAVKKIEINKTDMNKNGDCPYYKRKWWKFWVID